MTVVGLVHIYLLTTDHTFNFRDMSELVIKHRHTMVHVSI